MAIVVMDGVPKDTTKLLIHSCETLQERVVSPKLVLCPRQVGSVGVWTVGGGVVSLTIDGIPWGYRHPRICVVCGCDVAGCSNSNATISCVGPLSTFLRSAAGCPAPTAPDTVDCRVIGCTLGVLLGLVVAEVPG